MKIAIDVTDLLTPIIPFLNVIIQIGSLVQIVIVILTFLYAKMPIINKIYREPPKYYDRQLILYLLNVMKFILYMVTWVLLVLINVHIAQMSVEWPEIVSVYYMLDTFRCFEMMNLDILSNIFSADGVLKRGS